MNSRLLVEQYANLVETEPYDLQTSGAIYIPTWWWWHFLCFKVQTSCCCCQTTITHNLCYWPLMTVKIRCLPCVVDDINPVRDHVIRVWLITSPIIWHCKALMSNICHIVLYSTTVYDIWPYVQLTVLAGLQPGCVNTSRPIGNIYHSKWAHNIYS